MCRLVVQAAAVKRSATSVSSSFWHSLCASTHTMTAAVSQAHARYATDCKAENRTSPTTPASPFGDRAKRCGRDEGQWRRASASWNRQTPTEQTIAVGSQVVGDRVDRHAIFALAASMTYVCGVLRSGREGTVSSGSRSGTEARCGPLGAAWSKARRSGSAAFSRGVAIQQSLHRHEAEVQGTTRNGAAPSLLSWKMLSLAIERVKQSRDDRRVRRSRCWRSPPTFRFGTQPHRRLSVSRTPQLSTLPKPTHPHFIPEAHV